MPSTFAGLESARSGLTASQYGLDVTSQNVANAGTTGYSRQTLNMTSAGPYVGAYRTLPAGTLLGQGVNIGGTDQVRDEFLDTRYRSQNATYNEWKNLSDGLTSVENVVNEFTSDGTGKIVGISGQLKDLVDDLQSYSNTPDDANLPTTVKSDFQTLCQSIRTAYSSLESLSAENKTDLKITVCGGNGQGGVDTILDTISSLNKQIAGYEITGQKANDLRDQRNLALDQLSANVGIEVNEQSNGMVTVKLAGDTSGKMLVDSNNDVNKLTLNSDSTGVIWNDGSNQAANISGGTVSGYLKVINGDGSGSGTYGNVGIPYMEKKLNDFTNSFVAIVNNLVPSTGKALLDVSSDTTNPASVVDLTTDWKNNNSLFAENYTKSGSGSDIGSYILSFKTMLSVTKMNAMTDPSSKINDYNGSLQDYADTISMDISQEVSYDSKMATSNKTQLKDLDTQRKSVSSVSVDEEGINIIKFTQSYNAASRVITAMDEMLDKLINGTGRVGLS